MCMYHMKDPGICIIPCFNQNTYRIHRNKRPWVVKIQRPLFCSQAPMGAYLGGHLNRVNFCVPGESQMKLNEYSVVYGKKHS